MPHITLEISENITINNPKMLLNKLNQALFATGHFRQINDIKSRIYYPTLSLVGDDWQAGFVAVTLKLLAGHTTQIKNNLAETVLNVLQDEFAQDDYDKISVQCSVEILELSDNYQKMAVS